MALFSDLPLDLLPLIVANLLDPVDVASLCLVNHTFRTFSVPKLYERISIYAWQRSSKLRVTQLFRTLAEHPNLACLVRQLVITDFPKAQDSFAYEHLGGWFTKGLENCVKLRCCTWTRDCSLTSRILKSLGKCPELTDISINGCHSDLYEPGDLLQLLRLHKISLIRPSKPILEILPSWFQATGISLTSLTLICKARQSSIRVSNALFINNQDDMYITDAFLNTVSPHLSRLERLHLVGCQRVTNEGVWSMIRNRTRDLKELSLENLSPNFDMSTLSTACTRAGGLTSLSSFTLTIHLNWSTGAWMDGAVSLLKVSPLGSLNVSVRTPLKVFPETLRDRFCMRIVDQHRDHLIRFSLHGLLLDLASIDHVCLHCSKLEQLFICVDHAKMAPIVAILARANLLCAIHINIKVRPERCSPYSHALDIARQCSSTISQVGIDAEVWKVERCVLVVKGTAQVDRFLTKVENPDIPERFLVVRT
ncbi:hypothetical protein EDB92DRAFT_1792366 [Lactarius akahatsu]|uniref:F-box domain-containing protein n=1 Tax=Lactarius akahatsu TaxID=416441 RepID=A0AAD4LS92_9AGAM|nr:hypothetical protein EDB92DRAFT_1792366 [Lactarius akahatsu]